MCAAQPRYRVKDRTTPAPMYRSCLLRRKRRSRASSCCAPQGCDACCSIRFDQQREPAAPVFALVLDRAGNSPDDGHRQPVVAGGHVERVAAEVSDSTCLYDTAWGVATPNDQDSNVDVIEDDELAGTRYLY